MLQKILILFYYSLSCLRNCGFDVAWIEAEMGTSRRQTVEALLIDKQTKLWSNDFKLDPIEDPFPNDIAAQILLLDRCDLMELIERKFISTSCNLNNFDHSGPRFLCYWDILDATVFMSLVSVGFQTICAAEIAHLICDLLAHHHESAATTFQIDVFYLAEIIQGELRSFSEYTLETRVGPGALSLKLAIDILNVHARCLSYSKGVEDSNRYYGRALDVQDSRYESMKFDGWHEEAPNPRLH